jgi:hypothetical protein
MTALLEVRDLVKQFPVGRAILSRMLSRQPAACRR